MSKSLFPLYFLLLIGIVGGLEAQNYEIDWGPVFKNPGKAIYYFESLGMDDQHYYLLSGHRKQSTILTFDFNHQLIRSEETGFGLPHRPDYRKYLLHTPDGAIAYFTGVKRYTYGVELWASNFTAGQLSEPRLLVKHRFEDLMAFNGFSPGFNGAYDEVHQPNQQLLLSPDGQKLASVVPYAIQDLKGTKQKVMLHIFDRDYNLLWEKKQVLPYAYREVYIEQALISDAGEVFLLARKHLPKKVKKKQDLIIDFSYLIFRIGEEELLEYPIELGPTAFATDAGMFFPKDRKGEFLVAGLYTSNRKEESLSGIFLSRGTTSAADGTPANQLLPFNERERITMNQFDRDKDADRNFIFRIRDLVEFDDGAFALLASNDLPYFRYTTGSDGSASGTYQYYGAADLALICFDQTGNLITIPTIERSPAISDKKAQILSKRNNKLYLTYNCLAPTGLKRRNKQYNYASRLAVFNSSGKLESDTELYNDSEVMLQSNLASTTEQAMLLCRPVGRKEYSFGLLKLH